MLVIIVLGTQPMKTDLVFDTLQKCLIAGDLMRSQQLQLFYESQSALRELYGGSIWNIRRWWNEEALMRRRLGMENETTCIPHSLQ